MSNGVIIKVHKESDYTVINNDLIRNRSLSLRAKGLMCVILGLPDDWDYSIMGLCSIVKESRATLKKVLSELKEQGYLQIEQVRNDNGTYSSIWHIYELSTKLSTEGQNKTSAPRVKKPTSVFCTQLNKHITNNKNKTIYSSSNRKTDELNNEIVDNLEDLPDHTEYDKKMMDIDWDGFIEGRIKEMELERKQEDD